MRKFHPLCSAVLAVALLTGSAALSGCAHNESDPLIAAASDAPHLVSVERALAALEQFQPGGAETRSQKPAVAGIETLTRNGATRNTASDAPLAYIAHFEGDGYAILGADDRQAPVVAYVPKGSLTAAELSAAKTAAQVPGCELNVQVRAAVVNYLEKAAANVLPYETSSAPEETASSDRQRIVGPPAPPTILLECEWDQGAPYNASCDLVGGIRAKTGSLALALGQVLISNHRYFRIGPTSITYRISPMGAYRAYSPNWSLLYEAVTSATLPANAALRTELSQLLMVLGKVTGTQYGINESVTDPWNVYLFLYNHLQDYNNILLGAPNAELIRKMVLIKKKPVIAFSSYKQAWVIDGWQEMSSTSPNGQTVTLDYYHCRYGNRGIDDGWYVYMQDPVPMSQTLTYDLKGLVN